MPELTEKEYEVLKLKGIIFDLIKENDMHVQKSKYIQTEIQRLMKVLDEKVEVK